MPHGDMRVEHEQGTASGSWSWSISKEKFRLIGGWSSRYCVSCTSTQWI